MQVMLWPELRLKEQEQGLDVSRVLAEGLGSCHWDSSLALFMV